MSISILEAVDITGRSRILNHNQPSQEANHAKKKQNYKLETRNSRQFQMIKNTKFQTNGFRCRVSRRKTA